MLMERKRILSEIKEHILVGMQHFIRFWLVMGGDSSCIFWLSAWIVNLVLDYLPKDVCIINEVICITNGLRKVKCFPPKE